MKKRIYKKATAVMLSILLSLPLGMIDTSTTFAQENEGQTSVFGDVNNDQVINIVDVLMMKSYVSGEKNENFNTMAADIDTDGKVLPKDTVYLAKYFLGSMSLLPVSANNDSDKDGLNDYIEKSILKTNPLKADSDGDGINDYNEIFLCDTDPLKDDKDSSKDTDGDGLNNLEEIKAGTSPQMSDTDGDGLNDGEEINVYKSDPLIGDTDGDGISDKGEIVLGTDPLNKKTDGTLDIDKMNDQKLDPKGNVLNEFNLQNDFYQFGLSAECNGYIEDIVNISESSYSKFLEEDEIYGQIIDVKFNDEYSLKKLSVNFEMKNISNAKDYMIFKYSEEATMLLPVETTYSGNTLTAADTDDGTYCVANIAQMASNYATELECTETIDTDLNNVKASSSSASTINLAYEIFIDDNCSVPGWNEISTAMKDTVSKLQSNKYSTNISIIFNVCNYSVDISCTSLDRLSEILNTATSFFNNSNINTLDDAYDEYINNRAAQKNVWKDFSNYYTSQPVESHPYYKQGNMIFLFNNKSIQDTRCCRFNINNTSCKVYSKYIKAFKKMFDMQIVYNINKPASTKMYSLLTYSNKITSKIPFRISLFGNVLFDALLSDKYNGDMDNDGKKDSSEFDLSRKTTFGKASSSSSSLLGGSIQFQSYLSTSLNKKVDLNDQEIVPMISDPTSDDADGDGILDNEDNAPFSKGILDEDNKLVIGELSIVSGGGDSCYTLIVNNILSNPYSTGHAFILYKSYIKDSLDLSGFNSGYDYRNPNPETHMFERNYDTGEFLVNPNEYISMGAGGDDLDDAQCSVYNRELCNNCSYCPNAYITKTITADNWNNVLESFSEQSKKDYDLVTHNCTHVALKVWNNVGVSYKIHLIGIDTPTSLYKKLCKNDEKQDIDITTLMKDE